MRKPIHFRVEEFVPPEAFKKRGQKAIELMDDRIIITADQLKKAFPDGTITINNWVWGGSRVSSGLRIPSSPHYSSTSQHSFGRAIDAVFSSYHIDEVRGHILANPDKFPHINFMEVDISWLHVDCRNCERITQWSPTRGFIRA